MIIGLLGILKAGGAYVPLDPDYPQERLQFMLQDTNAPVLITQSHLQGTLQEVLSSYIGKTVILDQLDQTLQQQKIDNLTSLSLPHHLAYVIYTSGSTGKPKGVMVEHKSLINFLLSLGNKTNTNDTSRLLGVTTLAFDIAGLEIYSPLLNGGTFILINKEVILDPNKLAKAITHYDATIMQATPTTWQLLVDNNWKGKKDLQALCGGESINIYLLNQLANKVDRTWNLYGPTETTIWSSSQHYAKNVEKAIFTVSIGQPILNTQIYILDSYMNPIPIGVSGEIYIGGVGLARGYLNRADLTGEKFIPNLFVSEEDLREDNRNGKSLRLYRTGDLARYLPDGNIEFIGRIDDQVKIRGFRIELGEIESTLLHHRDVNQAVVVAREDEPGHKRLVAYVISQKSNANTSTREGVSRWENIYNDVYKEIKKATDITFNTIGWNSSYTGEPIPDIEMTEWVDNTISHILSLKPKYVLEIGCGAGLLLSRIAPHCQAYWGTDFSERAINHLCLLKEKISTLKHIELLKREANNFEGIKEKYFDVIVLNSVVQYFPNIDYLKEVLKGAVRSLRKNGVIFIGDVRNLSLLKTYASSVEYFRAPENKTKAQIEKSINERLEQEKELVIDPRFFLALQEELEEISYIKIQPKRGWNKNELTKFRYDVLLYVHNEVPKQQIEWLNWTNEKYSLLKVEEHLLKEHPNSYGLQQVRNARLQSENKFISWLQKAGEKDSLREFTTTLKSFKDEGINPEDLWKLGKRLRYKVEISWHNAYEDGAYDVAFIKDQPNIANTLVSFLQNFSDFKSIIYVNNPSQKIENIERSLQLQKYLQEYLPDYMIPSFFVFIDKVPLTPTGKIDRKSLPPPNLSLRQVGEQYVAPTTTLEQELCAIWAEVLKIDKIGIHDNFFRIGGHSLLATQVISRIRHTYAIDLALRSLFEHPTIHALSQDIEYLTTQNILSVIPPIVVQQKPNPLPLSFAQQRLWFLDQLLLGTALYNIFLALKLTGPLNLKVFETAFNALIDRHESLRTIFPITQGEAHQLILPLLSFKTDEYLKDLSSLPQKNQPSYLETLTSQEANTPFNLSSGPLIRLKLVKLSAQEHILLITMHHIISDGWSMEIFFKELSELYNAYLNHQEPNLPSLPIQYTDFAIWQRQWLQGEVLEAQLSYWKQQLSDVPDLLELPTDKPRPKELTYKGASYHCTLSKEIKNQLNALSQQQGTSLFMTLLALFQVLLYRHTGQKDIIVGSPIANRHYKEIEGLIGFFVNTLALKTSFEGNESFLDILAKVKETTLQAYQHQDVPFEQLVDYLNITRSLNRNPIFQVMFVLQNATTDEEHLALQNIKVNPVFSDYPIAKFDLSINAFEHEEGISIGFEYAVDLFEEKTIKRFGTHFESLIKEVFKDPSQSIYDFSLLTPTEQHQILIEWNDTKAEYPEDKTIHQLFEEQVEKTPGTIAVVYQDKELTYQQLNEKANQLAHYLRSLGVGPDTLVAIAVERSFEMIIGLLGILKAGGAYVPLDPDYPQERLQFMLQDTNAPVLITQSHLQGTLQETLSSYTGKTVILDQLDQTLQQQKIDNLTSLTLPHHLAYVIYTSGSTGKPKGVLINHQSLSNRLVWMQEQYKLNYLDHILQKTPFTFDVSVWEIFLPLIIGAVEVIAKPQGHKDAEYISNIIQTRDISVIHFVPSMLDSYLQTKNLKTIENKFLRLTITSGETLSFNLAKEHHTKIGSELHNLYGPTEASIDVTSYFYDPKKDKNIIPIGCPISNTQIYILDSYMNPVPIGVSGEIYIGGVGLARGYLNHSDLTAEKFVPNPFENAEELRSALKGELENELKKRKIKSSQNLRLYRTGDLARYLPDGNIEFIGRIDDQVKIRGFRIELGEVESSLTQHSGVNQAVVITREDEPGHKQLIAYIVPNEESILSSPPKKETISTSSSKEEFAVLKGEDLSSLTENLRNHLARSLPDYMIPAFFVFIDKVPLTPNGKIDRKSLPALDLSLRQIGDEYVAPQTSLQQELCTIWSEVLRVEKIGIHDNFFKLGGHSLLATQIISRIRHAYTMNLPLRSLFEHPTLYALSQDIEHLTTKKILSVIPPIIAQQRPESLPLSFAQQRLWFLDQLLPNTALYNVPLALKLAGPLNSNALEKAFNSLINRHEILRTIFPATKGEAQQLILPYLLNRSSCLVDFSTFTQEQQQKSVETSTFEEANTPFNLSSGPLIRLKLLKLSSQNHVLLMTIHHIIFDGWSMGILFKELSALYNAYLEDQDPTLTPLPIQYADFALWQKQWLQGEVLEAQLSYWKQQLSNTPELLEIPTDKLRPKELTYRGAAYHCTLSKEIKDQLNYLSQQQGTSLFITLLAFFQVLLYRYTGQKDIIVGSPIANRHYKEIEDLIGFFVNTLVLKTSFEGNETFLDVLNKVKETTLQAYQHQDVPFEQLVDYLNATRTLNRNPLFQVLFVLQNAPTEREELILQNVQTVPIFSEYLIAKFDLSVSAFEHEQGIDINFQYATDLFEEKTIKRFAHHFETLITQTLKNPSLSIHDISLLTPVEEHQIFIEWNDTKAEYPEGKAIHQLFEEQVEKTPNNIAVTYEGQDLTYQQLNEKANQLAHYLRSLGVGPDTLVAIAVERSFEMIIGLLGILKAGGAYVPLDSSYPQERLQFMLEDTKASILVTQFHLQNQFKEYAHHIVCLKLDQYSKNLNILDEKQSKEWNKEQNDESSQNTTQFWITLSLQPSSNPILLTLPHHLAYLIYTSGSTGKPKGVMVTHKNITNYCSFIAELVITGAPLNFLHLSTFAADLGNTSLYTSILKGHSLHILPDEYALNPEAFVDYVIHNNINFIKITPSHYKLLSANLNCYKFNTLYLFLGGEILKQDLLFNKENIKSFNHYGPTETTVGCCVFKVDPLQNINQASIPIGRPISNTQIYILDSYQHPVPIGVSGEIYIGGVGLARGYLNRADLTAEKFVPNPFVKKEDLLKRDRSDKLRLYRTGDLARYLPDGNIEFIDRIDDQVKIRGFRVELKEVESTLVQHGDVHQAVVVARKNELEHKQLVAYVIPGEFIPTITELQEFLSTKLPDYMIPAFFVFVDKVPLTLNGKIDREALPAPDLSLRQAGDEYVAPQSDFEKDLYTVWSKVLKIKKIGVHDNFFKLGGDSIIGIQLVAKSRQKGINITIKDIFNYPTISELSLVARADNNIFFESPSQENLSENIPLTPIQHWFFEQNFPQKHHYNQSMILKLNKKISSSLLKKAFYILLHHHDILRAKYTNNTSSYQSWTQTYTPSYSYPFFTERDLSSINNKDLSGIICEQANTIQQSLNIQKGILLKVIFFCCGELSDRLLIVIHHLVIDGVSWRILLDDLQSVCDNLLSEMPPKLPFKTHSYAQWAKTLQLYSNSALSELSYWQDVEHFLVPHHINKKVPLFSSTNTTSIHTISVSLTAEQTSALIRNVPQTFGTEINDILLTALVLAIGDINKKYELSLTLEGHGREDIIPGLDVSYTIGWFTSLFPTTLKIDNPDDLASAINSIKKQLNSIPHKGIGYSILKYLSKSSLTASLPLLKFNYLGQWDNIIQEDSIFTYAPEFTGNDVSPYNIPSSFLSLNGGIQRGLFSLSWHYSRHHFDKKTIQNMADHFIKRLKAIIFLCYGSQILEHNHSNFSLILDKSFSNHSQSLFPSLIKKIIVPFHVKDIKSTIFFIHPIGGEIFWYKNICNSISLFFNTYGIRSIFIDNEVLLPKSIEEMVLLYIEAILQTQKEGPYIIAGWSFGGKIAYEISKKMICLGYHIQTTIIIDETTNLKKNQINKYISDYKSNKNLLKINKELLYKYQHYILLKKHKLEGKINNILLFKSEDIDKKTTKINLGWEKHSDQTSCFIVGKDHYDIVSYSNSTKIAQIILNLFHKNTGEEK